MEERAQAAADGRADDCEEKAPEGPAGAASSGLAALAPGRPADTSQVEAALAQM